MAQCEGSLYFSLMAVRESEETRLIKQRQELGELLKGKTQEEKEAYKEQARDLCERMERLLKDRIYETVHLTRNSF